MTTDELRTWMKALEERDVRIVALEKRLAALETQAAPSARAKIYDAASAKITFHGLQVNVRPLDVAPRTYDNRSVTRRFQTLQHLAWALHDGLTLAEVREFVAHERKCPGVEPARGRPPQAHINRAAELLDAVDGLNNLRLPE